MAAQESDKSIRYKIAMTDVRDHGMSVREAAIKWNIPKSTLHDRLNGKSSMIVDQGHQAY